LKRALMSPWDRDAISRWGRSRTWSQVASEVIAIQQSLIRAKPAAFPSEPAFPHVRH
jgi:hypothetical protein